MAIHINSLKPGTFAQAKPSASLRLVHLAWASLKQWLLHFISLRRDRLAWASHTIAQKQHTPRLNEDSIKQPSTLIATPLRQAILT